MSEILATIGLLGIGYLVTNKKNQENEKKETFMNNTLSKVIDGEKIEAEAALANNSKENHIRSLEKPLPPNKTNVKTSEVVSMLSGKVISEKEFKTRNDGRVMEPFFGKNVTQNTKDLNIPNRLMELNGISEFSCKKTETKPFFAPTSNLTYVNGTPIQDEEYKQRYYVTNKRQSELPFEQVRVAPGLGQNYGENGVGGFQQFETQELMKPKNIDQLRSKNNPKMQYKGRVISGKRANDERGKVGSVDKNRPDKYYKNSPDRYFKTTGAVLKPKSDESFIVKNTNRQTSRAFVGGAKTSTEKAKLKQQVKAPHKNVYMAKEPSNATAVNQWKDVELNYGKAGYKAYPNERDITQKRTNRLNLTTAVKSLITPLQDLMKTTKKENFVGNNRPEGNMNASMPKKMTVYDPNDVARTTIKETTIDNKHNGNMAGPKKLTAYDPNDVARTTIKETTIDNKHNGHVQGLKKKHKVQKYDTKPKTTIRETMENPDFSSNVVPTGPRKLKTFNRANPPKKTTKETTVEDSRAGFIHGGTTKGGYMVDPAEAPNTSKQFLSNHEYTGNGQSSVAKPLTYDSSYNASLNINKEQIAKGREPTQEGAKVANGRDTINMLHKKQMSAVSYPKINKGPDHIKSASEMGVNLSHYKDQLSNNTNTDRIQPEFLEVLKENPYAHSVTEVGTDIVIDSNKNIESENEQLKLRKEQQDEIDRIIEEEIAKLV
jgi:hypothetical protein